MRSLFLSPTVPYPPVNGGHHRTLGCARCLARTGPVTMLAVGDPGTPRSREARAALAEQDIELHVFAPSPAMAATMGLCGPAAMSHFRSSEIRGFLHDLAARGPLPGLVHLEELVMTQYMDLLPRPRILDRQKIEWVFHEAMARVEPQRASWHRAEAERYRQWERSLVGTCDRILVAGAGDKRELEALYGPDLVTEIPIAISDELAAPTPRPRGVSFVLLYGARDYAPNLDAEAWFIREVWPTLATQARDLRLVIVGSGAPPPTVDCGRPDARVEVLGFVPDVASILGGTGTLAVPLRVGGGARTKVLEAMACGMPVVSTALGVENLALLEGRDYLRAESAQEMVESILALVRDPDRAAAVGMAGSQRAQGHRWSQIERILEPVYRKVASIGSQARFVQPAHARAHADRDAPTGETGAAPRRPSSIIDRARDALLRSGWGPGIKGRLDALLAGSGPHAGPLRRVAAWIVWRLVRH